MKCIQLMWQAQAPLAIGRSKPGGSISQTETYIPGSVIRGAIASELIRLSGAENQDFTAEQDDFNALFLAPILWGMGRSRVGLKRGSFRVQRQRPSLIRALSRRVLASLIL